MKHNGYLTFQTIIDIAGARGAISHAVCVGSPTHNNYLQKKSTNKHTKNFARVGTIAQEWVQIYGKGGQNERRHYIAWFDKVRPKKKVTTS